MKKIFILITGLLIISLLYADNQNGNTFTDSLEKKLLEFTVEEKVDTLNTLSNINLSTSPDKAYEYAKRSMEIAKNSNYDKGYANALTNIGNVYYNWSNYENNISWSF